MEEEKPFQGTGKGGARIESGQKSSRRFLISNTQFYFLFISPLSSYSLIPLISPFSTFDLPALFYFGFTCPDLSCALSCPAFKS